MADRSGYGRERGGWGGGAYRGGGDQRGSGGRGGGGGGDQRGRGGREGGGGGAYRGGGDPRGGVGREGGGGGAYRGGGEPRGGVGREGGGRGGGKGKSTVVISNDMMPKSVSQDMLKAATLQWSLEPLKPPRSKGIGTIEWKTINLILNHMDSVINLRTVELDGFYQYEVDIDLDDESKLKKKARAAKNEDRETEKSQGKQKEAQDILNGEGALAGDGGRDAPSPALWKKLVLRAVDILEADEARLYKQKNIPNPTKVATDGMRGMYTVHPFRTAPEGIIVMVISLSDLDEYENSYDSYVVTVRFVNKIRINQDLHNSLQNMREWLQKNDKLPENFVDIDRIYNIALKTPALRAHTPVGRASFFPMPRGDGFYLGGGLVNWTGFSLTYTMGWKPFVTVDVANTTFLLGVNVLDVLDNAFNAFNGNANPGDMGTWRDFNFEKAEEILRTCKVTYTLDSTGQRFSRRVAGISGDIATNHKFDSDKGPTNVEEYFRVEKRMPLRYPNGPVLLLGRAYVPAEFCTVVKGQVWKHKLGEAQTAAMIKDTAKPPAERLNKINESIRLNDFQNQPLLRQFGISVPGQLMVLKNARILPPPTLVYQGSAPQQQSRLTPNGDGVWDMFDSNLKFFQPYKRGEQTNWGVVNLDGRGCRIEEVENFVDEMIKMGDKAGLNLGTFENAMKNYLEMNIRPPYSRTFNDYFSKAKAQMLDFVLVITPRKDTNVYAAIKKSAEVDSKGGILTQCIVAKNLKADFRTGQIKVVTVGNILLKLNMKLGGINNLLYIDDRSLSKIDILKAPVIIMGADVTHPSKNSKFPSFAAVTSSTNRTGMPFMMHCQAQRVAGQGAAEIIKGLDVITMNMLAKFIEGSGHRPRKILFYRDGVGDSQFDEVLNSEMQMIRNGCLLLEKDTQAMAKAVKDIALGDKGIPYEPRITFIAVQKRHKTRFFPENPRDGVGRPQNAPPGTIVDTQIVSPHCTDFYLLSHIGIQGTSRPTRYQILWDDTNFTIDEIQVLTYYLCYCYCRCNRSVSYPAPTYYAHLAATRAKIFTTGASDEELSDIDELNRRIMRQSDLLKLNPMHFV